MTDIIAVLISLVFLSSIVMLALFTPEDPVKREALMRKYNEEKIKKLSGEGK